MSYTSNMIQNMMGGYGMPSGPRFGAPGMNMAMPQMDPNMARRLAMQRMQQASAQRMQQQRPQSGGPMPHMPPMVWGGQQGGMQPPFGMQGGPIQKGPMQQTGNPPMNMAMPMQGQSFGPQNMEAYGQRMQAANQAQQGGLMGMMGGGVPSAATGSQMGAGPSPQQSAVIGSDMGAGPSAAMANQQAMAQANQQAPAPTPRRNPYGMSLDMMARMNPNAARYYGGG